MCGIAGVASRRPNTAMAKMLNQMAHRGPDDCGTIEISTAAQGFVALGSTRLAIVDLSPNGHMPMRDGTSGNWIVFNGEIYNCPELRGELVGCGFLFNSKTDTEVILAAYYRWGRECLTRFRGMFAFALWDEGRKELFLARDRLGEKPLYYHSEPGLFSFASEVRSLLDSGIVERHLQASAVENYLRNGFIVAPQTLVEGIASLLPGHFMCVGAEGDVRQIEKYWRPKPRNVEDDTVESVRDTLRQSVTMRLMSDVPLGIFLSGGLDSSVIVALASGSSSVNTFSMGFDETEFDESEYAKWVARHFGTVHVEVRLGEAEYCSWFESSLDAMDQPTFDGVNVYCVSRAAREHGLTVALSGLGSDELFAGYDFFRKVPLLQTILNATKGGVPQKWLNQVLRHVSGDHLKAPWKFLEAYRMYGDGIPDKASSRVAAYQVTQLMFPWWLRESLLLEPPAWNASGPLGYGMPPEFMAMLIDDMEAAGHDNWLNILAMRMFLGERCLRDADTMSMAVSLEVRPVFTDHVLIETLLGIPFSKRCAGAPDKPFAWELFRSSLGDSYPLHKKQGFIMPFEKWLRSDRLKSRMEEYLLEPDLCRNAGLRPEAVRSLLRNHGRSPELVPWSRVWMIFTLIWWCTEHGVSM